MYLFIPSRNTFVKCINLYYINSFMYLLYLFVYINVSLIKFIIPPHSYSHVPRRGCICPHPPPEAGGIIDLWTSQDVNHLFFLGEQMDLFRVAVFFPVVYSVKNVCQLYFLGIGGLQLEPAAATSEENWKTLLSFNVIHFCLNDGNNFGL